ncbi:hypothetical protein DPMN_162988 [Dreissena polymorpha]|uniref:Uncharacterized protein n=1 Tax=Dreissena polymorpha TaxID=45954 RepID=A0A9D4EUY4_DREPO|nr:hypothetical protein DPMN_162988 [Dreissena polymorpha]
MALNALTCSKPVITQRQNQNDVCVCREYCRCRGKIRREHLTIYDYQEMPHDAASHQACDSGSVFRRPNSPHLTGNKDTNAYPSTAICEMWCSIDDIKYPKCTVLSQTI